MSVSEVSSTDLFSLYVSTILSHEMMGFAGECGRPGQPHHRDRCNQSCAHDASSWYRRPSIGPITLTSHIGQRHQPRRPCPYVAPALPAATYSWRVLQPFHTRVLNRGKT